MMTKTSATLAQVEPNMDVAAFEPFHGFPHGLKIHIVDKARLTSLGEQMVTAEADKNILNIDELSAALHG